MTGNNSYLHVTQVIPTPKGFDKVPEGILDMAKERGIKVHGKLRSYILSKFFDEYAGIFLPELDYECEGYFISGKNWIDSYVEKVVFVEKRFVHPIYKYEGTPDLGAFLKGHKKPSLVDFKTPIAYYEKEWSAQLSAYDNMIYHCEKIEFGQLLSVRVREKGKKALVNQVKQPNISFHGFLNALGCYRYFGRGHKFV